MNPEYAKRYRETHKARIQECQRQWEKQWRQANPEKARLKNATRAQKYQATHREQIQQRHKAYYLAHREVILEKTRIRHMKNRDRDNARLREWQAHHPEKNRLYVAKRRALEVAATANLQALEAFVEHTLSKKTAICYYCRRRTRISKIHFDHIIPLTKGGQHSVENLCVSCSLCNRSKHARLLPRWTKHPQLFLEI